jgi:hypothetical protein
MPNFQNRVSLQAMLRQAENAVQTQSARTLVDAQTVFTITGSPIMVIELVSFCVTANDTTAATLRWNHTPATGFGSAATFSGVSASTASMAAGSTIVLNATAITTAPDIRVAGISLGSVKTNNIILPPGVISLTIASGPSTGTFLHYLRFRPLGLVVNVF